MKDTQCKMLAHKFAKDESFDLGDLGNGKGVRHLTVRNTGDCTLYIADVMENVEPNQTFTINSPLSITNNAFQIKFHNPEGVKQEAVLRYLVDAC